MRTDWAGYPRRLEGELALVFVDLALWDHAPIVGLDTLYSVRIQIPGPDAHGLANPAEIDALETIEEVVATAARDAGFSYLGGLNLPARREIWFMGAAGRSAEIEALVRTVFGPWKWHLRALADPEWSFYREFVFPNQERMQWIHDRAMVEAVQECGDLLTKRRPVSHVVRFPNDKARRRCATAATRLGFECHQVEPLDDMPFPLLLERVDAVDLDSIHAVVMTLVRLVQRHRGEYAGWETDPVKEA